jgi:CRP-like cAMP-binding protein
VTNSTSGNRKESALEPLVRKLSYRTRLDERDRAAILALPHTVKSMEPHQYVVREGDRPTHSCLLLEGFSIRHKCVVGGKRQIMALHMRGEMVDLENSLLGQADHNVQMLTAGKVAFIPKDEITRIAFEYPTVGQAMWLDTLVDGSIFREWIANVGRRDAQTRVAHVLCEFALRLKHAGLGDESGYHLPMTQEQIADVAGLTSVHVNRSIKNLESEGLISRVSPREIVIGDWKRLAAKADFDSLYLHMREGDPVLA